MHACKDDRGSTARGCRAPFGTITDATGVDLDREPKAATSRLVPSAKWPQNCGLPEFFRALMRAPACARVNGAAAPSLVHGSAFFCAALIRTLLLFRRGALGRDAPGSMTKR
ncbi:hypothetical protein MTO96_011687 [Rhipicephalus appendiculatus]